MQIIKIIQVSIIFFIKSADSLRCDGLSKII
nr:MAG TPA: hypothetical protein [Caudoviricetes sp.]